MTDDIERRLMSKAEILDIAPPEATQALSLALYAVHDLLVTKGVLEPGEAAANLRRFISDDDKLGGFIAAIAAQLDEMPFKPTTTRDIMSVVDGGKQD